MEKITAELENLTKSSYELMEKMEEYLVKFVKKVGETIWTTDTDRCDTIYGIFYNEGTESYEEHKVLAVKVEHNQLLIFADVYPDEKENWFSTDMIWRNATLHNLCETLPQYV